MEELWQRSLWASWLAEEERRDEGDLSGIGLTEVPPEVLTMVGRLDLSRNHLSGELPSLAASIISVADNKLSSIALQPSAVILDLSGNRIHHLPQEISRQQGLEELRVDRNLLSSLPPGSYRDLKVLSASNNRLTQLPNFLSMTEPQFILEDIEEDDEKPQKLQNVNLRGNSLKGTIILGNYGNLTQLDVSENSIESLDLRALEKLQNVQCSRNKLQELSVNGTSLTSLIAGNNYLTKLTIHPRPTKLKHLDISYNRLELLPEWVGTCQLLRTLFASHNLISSLPDRFFSSEGSLQTLQLSFNRLSSLPPLTKNSSLQQIFLQGNRIRTLPQHFFLATPRLRTLNLTKNRLEELPGAVVEGHQMERLYLTCNQLTEIDCLVHFHSLRLLHLSYNLVSQLPQGCVNAWCEMEELVISGNRLDSLPAGLEAWKHLRVLRLHCNLLQDPPALVTSSSLKVLDLSHNNLEKVNLSSLISKQLQFLDISGNTRLQVDPRQFNDYRSQRNVSLVDTSGKGRAALPTEPEQNNSNPAQWTVGFSETPGNRERLCVAQLRLTGFCGSEALLGLFDSGTDSELPKILASSIPRILLEERTVKETATEYMKYTLLAAHRELKERGQRLGCCALVCHMCSERGSGVKKRTLRVATVGEAKAVLARASSSLTLAHVPTQMVRSQIGNSSMYPLVIPDPHVTELTLRDDDRFLIMANKRLWEVVSAEEAASEVRHVTVPGLAAKRLQDLAQSYGCEDNLSVIVVSLQQTLTNTAYRLQEKADGCWCHVDRSSPSGQSDQASYGKASSGENFLHYITEKKEPEEHRFEPVLMRENGTRKMTSRIHDGSHFGDCEESPSERSGGGQMSEEQFRCWEYMLEQNTQLLFDKELGSISKAGLSPHQRKIFGSTRSNESCCQKNSAYFGTITHLPTQYNSASREKSETDSLETEDRMSKYWDVATTEL
ncbi:unnamed protein product [Nezara viridula]|uniref:PPM-type phosphatase domain-containing protein n=1 Tax=Nezara viridula TaxID=85310 RepID=A0A9P0E7Z7_NEZVI|nr:unnamed protein product [Nezara viridula]